MDSFVAIGNIVCWGAVVATWSVLGVRGRLSARGRSSARRGRTSTGLYLAALVVAVVVALAPQSVMDNRLSLDSPFVRWAGLAVLSISTLLALWARVALGTGWSIGPRVSADGGLRTDGPYALTRHPIYTGLLGMLIGSAALGGLGRWLLLPAVGAIVLVAKIRDEERLLSDVFPEQYAAYRREVPAIVPRPDRWLRRRGASRQR